MSTNDPSPPGDRRRRLYLLGLVVGLAIIGAVVAIAVTGGSGATSKSLLTSGAGPASTPAAPTTSSPSAPTAVQTPEKVPGANAVNALLTGIPSQGTALGNPAAPLTLEEFADLQCPYCREFEVSVLPDLIQRYVRAGKLRVVFSDISILGPDSSKAASYAAAAGLQNKLWPYIELWYQNQRQENTGYVTPSYLLHIATGIPGLDGARAARDSSSAWVQRQLAAADSAATKSKVNSTPSFLIGATGQPGQPLSAGNLTPADFDAPIQSALQQVGAG